MTTDTILLIYPERRRVTLAWIDQQYEDACANGDISDEVGDDPVDRIAALEDAGLITTARSAREQSMEDDGYHRACQQEAEDRQSEPLDPHGPWGAP